MDIIHILKPKQYFIKASYDKLSNAHRLGILVLVISLFGLSLPQNTTQPVDQSILEAELVFTYGDHAEYLANLTDEAEKKYRIEKLWAELDKQRTLSGALTIYLKSYHSPLANHAETLIKTNNWKKIIALANAESSLCRNYPEHTSNCWGVGGTDLWDMGDNLSEGIVAMNNFLENSPKRSDIKYSQMTFEQMNGLYKQPARDHWLYNNQKIIDDLDAIERNIELNT
ncbi:MAG: hypothetical protein Q8O75_00790 [bacterium]|nr:hypothetical protein [bacterium]